jgi:hypothetical protein
MTIHILFANGQPIAQLGDDTEGDLVLPLDDETQYRCAGFIQAEIDKFAENLDLLAPTEGSEDGGSDLGSSTEGEAPKAKGRKKRKGQTIMVASTPSNGQFHKLDMLVLERLSLNSSSTFRPSTRICLHQACIFIPSGNIYRIHQRPPQRCPSRSLRSIGRYF